jgi:hypothetical protein
MAQYREEWLQEAIIRLRTVLKGNGDVEVPEVRVAAGWPSKGGTSSKRRVLGECWKPEVSEDGIGQIFLNPMLDDEVEILGVLVHELIHAVHPEAGHKGKFIETAKAVGLVKPWTSTSVDESLEVWLINIANELGDYPHSKMTPQVQRKVQTTRMVKVVCPSDEYTVRTTRKWIDVGLPVCPCGETMEEAAA